MSTSEPPVIIEWGWCGRALSGPSGDRHVVVPFPGGALVALLDGLGHGPEAAAASLTAAPLLESHARDSVMSLVQRCHEGLRKTRGVVMSLASFNADDCSMTWISVGNVCAVLRGANFPREHPDEAVAQRGGVVGFQLPALRATTLHVGAGDTLIMATDGIRESFTTGLVIEHGPQEIAESIVARFAKPSDDAHVVVARYLG
jgi:phosphoserine phosphatase RsbX